MSQKLITTDGRVVSHRAPQGGGGAGGFRMPGATRSASDIPGVADPDSPAGRNAVLNDQQMTQVKARFASSTRRLTESEKRALIKRILAGDIVLSGDQLHRFAWAVDRIGDLDNAATVTDLVFSIFGIGEDTLAGALLATVGAPLSLLAALLFPVGAGIAIVNAGQTGLRLAGIAAVAYSITAWAFDDPVPPFPPAKRSAVSSFGGDVPVESYEHAWAQASASVIKVLENTVTKGFGGNKTLYQSVIRTAGDGLRQSLCQEIFRFYTESEPDSVKLVLAGYVYPN